MTEPYRWETRHDRRRTFPAGQPLARTGGGTSYGEAALASEVEELLRTAEGRRNAQLNIASFNLHQLVAVGAVGEQDVHDRLRDAALRIGLTPAETEATIASGKRSGLASPRQVPELSPSQVTEVELEALAGASTGTDSGSFVDAHTRAVQIELSRLRVQQEARRLFDRERLGEVAAFDAGTLADVLARPDTPRDRVQGLMPWEGSTLLTAQRKAGKTTTVLNLARSLLTGEDFLGSLGVRPLDGEMAILNYEVSGAQLARWADEVGVPRDRLFLVNLRGRRNPLTDDEDRGRLAALLRRRGVEAVVCDPFGRAFTGSNQNDSGEVGSFLVALDQFARAEVGALDLILTAHAGWNGERTRGSSALEDWPDSIVTLTKDETDEGQGVRYLRAFGRDVDLDEDSLEFNPDTRTLRLVGAGSRATARAGRKHEDLDRAVLSVVIANPGINGSGLGPALREAGVAFQKGEERKAVNRLQTAGQVEAKAGPRGAHCWHHVEVAP